MDSKQFIEDFEEDTNAYNNNKPQPKKVVKTKTRTELRETEENEVGPSVRKIPKCFLNFLFSSFITLNSKSRRNLPRKSSCIKLL